MFVIRLGLLNETRFWPHFLLYDNKLTSRFQYVQKNPLTGYIKEKSDKGIQVRHAFKLPVYFAISMSEEEFWPRLCLSE